MLLAGYTAQAAHVLRVNHTSGDVVHFVLDDQPQISFTGSKLKIVSTVNPQGTHFELDDIESLDFTEALAAEAPDAGLKVTTDREGVTITNVPEGATVVVCNLTGHTINVPVTADGTLRLLRADLQKGVYIIKINDFTLKTIL